MLNQNYREYKLIRQEMLNLKDCITTYLGFVISGSGAAFFGLMLIAKAEKITPALVYLPLAISAIISLVMLILFYKFNSHNRMAAYCKLLNHEVYDDENKDKDNKCEIKEIDNVNNSFNTDNLFSWEICIDRLRESDINTARLFNIFNESKFRGPHRNIVENYITMFTGGNASIDKGKYFKGVVTAVNALRGNLKSHSWNFPSFVMPIFIFLCFIFFIIGGYVAWNILDAAASFDEHKTLIFVVIVFTIFQSHVWISCIGKLYTLMKGSSTIEGYFWRFLPIRAHFLNCRDITPKYLIDD